MAPTFDRAWTQRAAAAAAIRSSEGEAYGKITQPFREFMLGAGARQGPQTVRRPRQGRASRSTDRATVDLRILIPAFMISEIRRGFEIGFLIALPFLVIDMIVSTLTMSMGMMMLPPAVISLADEDFVFHIDRRLEHARRKSHPFLFVNHIASLKGKAPDLSSNPREVGVCSFGSKGIEPPPRVRCQIRDVLQCLTATGYPTMSSLLTNMSAMSALQALSATQKNLQSTQNQISTGLRVQNASDNAAYWSISTTMKSDTSALSSVTRRLEPRILDRRRGNSGSEQHADHHEQDEAGSRHGADPGHQPRSDPDRHRCPAGEPEQHRRFGLVQRRQPAQRQPGHGQHRGLVLARQGGHDRHRHHRHRHLVGHAAGRHQRYSDRPSLGRPAAAPAPTC